MNIMRKIQLRKNTKRILSVMFSILLGINTLFPSFGNTPSATMEINYSESNSNNVTVQSEESKPIVEQKLSETNIRYSVEMNYSERYPKKLYIVGNKIRIEKVPLISKFNYIWPRC